MQKQEVNRTLLNIYYKKRCIPIHENDNRLCVLQRPGSLNL
jgi:hypothetical protein